MFHQFLPQRMQKVGFLYIVALLTALGSEGLLALARNKTPLPAFLGGKPISWRWGALLFLLALALSILASEEHDEESPAQEGVPFAREDVFLLLGLLLVAAAARLYQIDYIPPGLWLDETDIAKQAIEIVNGARPKPWHVARLEVPWLYHYYVALFYALLGPGYLTVKLPHLLISTLTVVPLYLLAREFMSRPLAFFAAFTWATMRWSVNMSRWGHVNTLTLFWFCIVLWLVWRSLTRDQWRYWILGGIALGLSQYSYQATRALVAVTFAWMVYALLAFGPRKRHRWLQIATFWGIFVLVYAPLAWTYLHNPDLFLERSRAISIFNPLFTPDPWVALKENVGKYLGMFHFVGDMNGRHNIPGWPMLDPVMGVLIIGGLGKMLRHPLRPQHVLATLWATAFMAVGILTTEAPNTFRVYGMTPVIAVVGATGLRPLLSSTRFTRAALITSIPTIALLNLYPYFAIQATHPAVVSMFNVGPTKVGQYIATLPDDATIYLDREFWAFSPIEVINPGRPLVRLKTPDHVPPPPQQHEEAVYILGLYGQNLVPYLNRLYPTAQIDKGRGPTGSLIYTGVRVSTDQVTRKGLQATWWEGETAEGSPTGQGVFPPESVPAPPSAVVRLHGGLFVPRAGEYQLRVDSVRAISLRIARLDVPITPGVPATVLLPGGLIPVHIEMRLSEGSPPTFWWRIPDIPNWTRIEQQRWYPVEVPEGGLLALWFEGGGVRTPPVRISHAPYLFADNAGNLATSAMRWLGRIRIDEKGLYTFGLSSDDGSRLWIDGELVVDNWGLHGAGWRDARVNLEPGWHQLRIDYIDNGGSHWFEWRWAPPGEVPGPVPPEVLSWTWDDLRAALTPPPDIPPVIRVKDATGRVVGSVPVAAARLEDPKFNQPVGDANFQKWPMKLGSVMYDRGIGVYGPGELEFHLNGRYIRLQGMVGIDMDTYGDRHTRLQILGDGQILWDSNVVTPWDPPRSFDVDVTGVRVLILRQIESELFEGRGDGVDWVNITLLQP